MSENINNPLGDRNRRCYQNIQVKPKLQWNLILVQKTSLAVALF